MAIKTFPEYLESLRKLKPTAYMFGERIKDVVDNPRIRGGINATGATYELATSEKYGNLFSTISPFTGEPINRFTLPPQSIEDLVAGSRSTASSGHTWERAINAARVWTARVPSPSLPSISTRNTGLPITTVSWIS